MISIARRTVPVATLVQVAVEFSGVLVAGVLAIQLQGRPTGAALDILAPAFAFALLMVALNIGFGMYRRNERLSNWAYLVRMGFVLAIACPLAFLFAQALPGDEPFQQHVGLCILFAIGGLMLVRHSIVFPLVGSLSPYRVLVLGTGPEARLVEASLATAGPRDMHLVGFYPLEGAQESVVSPLRIIAKNGSFEETVKQLAIDEIIVAVREQRGGVLPLRALLDCRLNGVRVTDLAIFFERVHGQVAIEAVKVSWLIYSEGYQRSWIQRCIKRSFDVVFASTALLLALPIMIITAAMIALESGRPIFYLQERVGNRGRKFTLIKFRSMAKDAEKDGKPSWASLNDERATGVGRFIRRLRIDELPQMINVLKGEMSIVGPRPERPEFVAMLTNQIPFYAARHSCKPGITGWAQVRYSYGGTVEQAAKKLEYDLYYVKNQAFLLDIQILLETLRVVLLGEGAR